MKILLLGLSNKQGVKPFDSSTNSGKLVDMIIEKCAGFDLIKENLVPFAPLDRNGKLRYPNREELIEGTNRLFHMIDDYDCVVLFGKMVQDTVKKDSRFNEIKKIYAEHPSYIWVYKHKEIDDYIERIVSQIKASRNR